MKKLQLSFSYTMLLLLLTGCGLAGGTTEGILRSAEGTPNRFTPVAGVELEDGACKSPLIDPEDGTEIILVRSSGGEGDYRAPSGWYGLHGSELLRVNCVTGEVLGIVRE